MTKRKAKVRFERDESGHWTAVAEFSSTSSAISDGPTLDDVRRRIREASGPRRPEAS